MNVGMLWFDKSPGLTERVERAAAYYRKKYGQEPNLCLVHPGALAQLNTNEVIVGSIRVREFKSVLPMHLLIGIEDSKQSQKGG